MKIIKQGNPAVLAQVNQRFVCTRCGCEFIADWNEYEEFYPPWRGDVYERRCDCPECGTTCRQEVLYD